jgi:hypothetical protein
LIDDASVFGDEDGAVEVVIFVLGVYESLDAGNSVMLGTDCSLDEK